MESDAVWRTDFSHLEKEPLSVLLHIPAGGMSPAVEVRAPPSSLQLRPLHWSCALTASMLCLQAMSGEPDTASLVSAQRKKPPVSPNPAMVTNPLNRWGRFYATLGRQYGERRGRARG